MVLLASSLKLDSPHPHLLLHSHFCVLQNIIWVCKNKRVNKKRWVHKNYFHFGAIVFNNTLHHFIFSTMEARRKYQKSLHALEVQGLKPMILTKQPCKYTVNNKQPKGKNSISELLLCAGSQCSVICKEKVIFFCCKNTFSSAKMSSAFIFVRQCPSQGNGILYNAISKLKAWNRSTETHFCGGW